MYLKMMNNEPLADGDNRKTFQLLGDVIKVEFTRDGRCRDAKPGQNVPCVGATFMDGTTEWFDLAGNAYVLNDDGKTIESFSFTAGKAA